MTSNLKAPEQSGPMVDLAVGFSSFLATLEASMAEEKAMILAWVVDVETRLLVGSVDDLTQATEVARLAKARLDSLEADRTKFSKPLHTWGKQVNAVYAGLSKPLDRVVTLAKERMGAFALDQANKRAAVMQQSAAQLQVGIMPTTPIPEAAEVKGVTIKATWVAFVTDPTLVPREYCSPDLGLIQAAIWYADSANTPPRPIPGVDYRQETQTIIRKG